MAPPLGMSNASQDPCLDAVLAFSAAHSHAWSRKPPSSVLIHELIPVIAAAIAEV